jgi:hypothetical protein
MATDDTVIVHPGDIVQDSEGQFYLVASTHKWGVGAVQRWTDAGQVRETYSRLRPGQFVVVGTGHLLPEEVAQARRDSLRLAADLARDALADPDDLTPQWDVEVRFNGRTTGAGQKHNQRVKADCVEEALDKVKHPVGQHGGAICIVGVTVDEVRR